MTTFEAEARRFAVDCTGATAVEYALLLGGIAVVVAAATALISGALADIFSRLSAEFSS